MTTIKSKLATSVSNAAKAVANASPVKVSASFTRIDTVEGCMKPLTQPLADLDNLIAAREAAIDNAYVENQRLRAQIEANIQRIDAHQAEIDKARDASNKLRAVIG
ncbi:hypothetical protein CPT_Paso_004 [Rhizobium phage Paso]|uniref:Uncharacterized protein n=1 Tax=Rhizobium phage Paso TaxID=2767574 RepID=A0A7L8G5V1_9CAUD|nr:hypothetical protein CPT_Paso_004 [Rhizobium phage Paso]